jgi:hypothetical protein
LKFSVDLHIIPLSRSGFRQNWCNESHTLRRGVSEILPHFAQSYVYTVVYSRCPPQFIEVRENWRSEIHTSLTGVNEFPSVFYTSIA